MFLVIGLLFVLPIIYGKTVSANEIGRTLREAPPTIIAESRTVIKDDLNFNIMDNVSAYDFLGNDLTSNIHVEGKVDIHTAGVYPITFTVKDYYGVSGNKSIEITVKSDEALLPPKLDEVTDSDTIITGTGMPGAKVYVILGTNEDIYSETIKNDGTFIITLDHTYIVGSKITAYVEDEQGNRSEDVYSVVQSGNITLGVNEIVSSDTFISGYTSPYANIEISLDNTRSHIFRGKADSTGKYKISLNGLNYPAGTTIVVTAELNGRRASKTVIVYPKLVHLDTLSVGSAHISGIADPYAVIYIFIGTQEYQFTANAAGYFFGNLDSPLVSGDRVTAYQISNDIQGGNTTIEIQ